MFGMETGFWGDLSEHGNENFSSGMSPLLPNAVVLGATAHAVETGAQQLGSWVKQEAQELGSSIKAGAQQFGSDFMFGMETGFWGDLSEHGNENFSSGMSPLLPNAVVLGATAHAVETGAQQLGSWVKQETQELGSSIKAGAQQFGSDFMFGMETGFWGDLSEHGNENFSSGMSPLLPNAVVLGATAHAVETGAQQLGSWVKQEAQELGSSIKAGAQQFGSDFMFGMETGFWGDLSEHGNENFSSGMSPLLPNAVVLGATAHAVETGAQQLGSWVKQEAQELGSSIKAGAQQFGSDFMFGMETGFWGDLSEHGNENFSPGISPLLPNAVVLGATAHAVETGAQQLGSWVKQEAQELGSSIKAGAQQFGSDFMFGMETGFWGDLSEHGNENFSSGMSPLLPNAVVLGATAHAVETGAQQLGSWVKQEAQELGSSIKAGAQQFGSDFMFGMETGFWGDLSEHGNENFSSGMSPLLPNAVVLGATAHAVETGAQQLGSWVKQETQELGSSIKAGAQQFGSDFMFGMETGFWGDLSEHGNENFSSGMSPLLPNAVVLGATAHAVETGAQQLGSWVKQEAQELGSSIKAGAQQFGSDFMFGMETGFWGDLSEHGNENFSSGMSPLLPNAVVLGATAHAVETGAQQLGSWVKQEAQELGSSIKAGAQQFGSDFMFGMETGFWGDLSEHGNETFSPGISPLLPNAVVLGATAHAVETGAQQLGSWVKQEAQELGSSIKAGAQQFGSDFMFGMETGFWGDLSEHGNENFSSGMSPLLPNAVVLGATAHAVETGAQQLGSWVKQEAQELGSSIKAGAQQFGSDFMFGMETGFWGDLSEHGNETFSPGISPLLPNAVVLGATAHVVETGAQQLGSWVKQETQELGSSIKAGMQQLGSWFKQETQELGSSIEAGARQLGSGFMQGMEVYGAAQLDMSRAYLDMYGLDLMDTEMYDMLYVSP